MSNFGAVPAAILTAVGNAITLGGSRDGFIAYGKIPPDQFPFAMVHSPLKEIERGDFQHGTETTATPLVVVWNGATMATVNAGVVAIEAQFATDPTLGGIVEDTWVGLVGRDESLDQSHVAAVFQVETRGTV